MNTKQKTMGISLTLFMVLSFFASVPISHAAAGDILADQPMPNGHPGARTSVGVAFDGTEFYLSGGGTTIHVLKLIAGLMTETREITTTRPYGALAYDKTRDDLWACYAGSPFEIERIDKMTGAVKQTMDVSALGPHFLFCDGLAFDARVVADPSDDVLYYSPDISPTIYRLNAITGALIDSFPFAPIQSGISTCGNSGIAVGGPDVWLTDNGCNHLFRADKPPTTRLGVFDAKDRPEDLECDDVTFAPKTAIWMRHFEDNFLTAYEAANPCGVGGIPPVHDVPEFNLAASALAAFAAIPIIALRKITSKKGESTGL